MKKIHIEFSDERLITPSGLVFVGQILGKSSFVKKINRAPISKDYLQKQIKNGDVLLTYIGMLCQEIGRARLNSSHSTSSRMPSSA